METNEKVLDPYELHLVELMRDGAKSVEIHLDSALKKEKSGWHRGAMTEIACAISALNCILILSKNVYDPDNVDNK